MKGPKLESNKEKIMNKEGKGRKNEKNERGGNGWKEKLT